VAHRIFRPDALNIAERYQDRLDPRKPLDLGEERWTFPPDDLDGIAHAGAREAGFDGQPGQ
jgi:hypothetical protein